MRSQARRGPSVAEQPVPPRGCMLRGGAECCKLAPMLNCSARRFIPCCGMLPVACLLHMLPDCTCCLIARCALRVARCALHAQTFCLIQSSHLALRSRIPSPNLRTGLSCAMMSSVPVCPPPTESPPPARDGQRARREGGRGKRILVLEGADAVEVARVQLFCLGRHRLLRRARCENGRRAMGHATVGIIARNTLKCAVPASAATLGSCGRAASRRRGSPGSARAAGRYE